MPCFLITHLTPSLQTQHLIVIFFNLLKDTGSFKKANVKRLVATASDPWTKEGLLQQFLSNALELLDNYPSDILSKICDDTKKIIDEGTVAISDKASHDQFLLRCESLAHRMAKYIEACPPDENLDFFLLKHQDECKKAFGRFFLLNLLKKKYRGIKETQNYLLDAFQKRGFSHLAPSIHKYIAGLTK